MYLFRRAFLAFARFRCWPCLFFLLAAQALSPRAVAQSAVGNPVNAATGRSLADAVTQNLNELIDQQVLTNQGGGTTAGNSSGPPGGAAQLGGPRMNANGPGAGGAAAVTGALAAGAMPTGRLRASEHEGIKPASDQAYSYSTGEASAFANVVVPIQGKVLGGQVKFSALVGTNSVDLKLRSNVHAALDPGQSASGTNELLLAGANILWSSQGTYTLASLIGFSGETKLADKVDTCDTTGCSLQRYKFNTSGFMATGAGGHVFNLAGPSGPKLDLRGSVAYIENKSDTYRSIFGFDQKYSFSTWAGTFGATLFTNVTMEGGGLLRPYVQAQVRQEWAYRSVLVATDPLGVDPRAGTFKHDQNHTYGGLTTGVTYNLDRLTFGAAVYTEYSGDERTLGARLGASWLLGGDDPQRPSAGPPAPPSTGWSGFYFGANAGYGLADVNMTNLGPDVFFGPVGGGDMLSPRAWLGGGQVGYNWQLGTLVFGLEGAWDMLALTDDRTGRFFPKDHWRTDISQIYAVTGRLGMPAGNWLPYIKGGFAGASVETSMVTPADAANLISLSNNWHTGWTIGGGVEYMFAPRWTVGLVYDRYSFDSKSVSAIRTGSPSRGETGVNDHWTVKPDNIQTITARMNFKLN